MIALPRMVLLLSPQTYFYGIGVMVLESFVCLSCLVCERGLITQLKIE
jgi:hypothetical protein